MDRAEGVADVQRAGANQGGGGRAQEEEDVAGAAIRCQPGVGCARHNFEVNYIEYSASPIHN